MKPTAAQIQDGVRRYLKIVEWSEVDRCYVGSAPPLIGQACHGATEAEVLTQLQAIVEEWVATLLTDGKPLPPATAGKNLADKLQRVA
jgi:predicted RNase H-like HicB family nuclease